MKRWLCLMLLLILPMLVIAQESKRDNKRKKNREKSAPTAPLTTAPLTTAPLTTAADDTAKAADIPPVIPVFDPGSHTRPIIAMGFTPDRSRLTTVAEDSSIQIWSTRTGERLDILRLPTFGHEDGYNATSWDRADVSSDGRYVAVGGTPREAGRDGDQIVSSKLLVVDTQHRTLRRIEGRTGAVEVLRFTPDGKQLAAVFSGASRDIIFYPGIDVDAAVAESQAVTLSSTSVDKGWERLSFSPDGRRLVAASSDRQLTIWDLSAKPPRLVKTWEAQGRTTDIAWDSSGQRFARCWTAFVRDPHGYAVYDSAGETLQETTFDEGHPVGRTSDPWCIRFWNADTLLVNVFDRGRGNEERGAAALLINLTSGHVKRVVSASDDATFPTRGALSADGQLAAITVAMGLDVIVFNPRDGHVVSHCGAASPLPTAVGWSKDPRQPGFAWSEQATLPHVDRTRPDLQFAFDLRSLEPKSLASQEDYVVQQSNHGKWSIDRTRGDDGYQVAVSLDGKPHGKFRSGGIVAAMTLVPRENAEPRIVWGTRQLLNRGNELFMLGDLQGNVLARLRPRLVHPRDVAASPDGKYVVLSTGSHRLCIYSTDGSSFPLLSFARVRGEWVLWTRDGFYVASPGGERLFGWVASNGPYKLASFHTADTFSRHYRRPDLLRKLIEAVGSGQDLSPDETRGTPLVGDILPPTSQLSLVNQVEGRVRVRGRAEPSQPDRPVIALRLLLNGKPLPVQSGLKEIATGQPAEAEWEIAVPAGMHELKLLARSADSSSVSAPVLVKSPKSASSQPILHRLCVGIDEYANSTLNLKSAAKDATDVFEALSTHCVGPENRFGTARGTLITNSHATRSAVLGALADLRKSASPGDLVVLMFACHGVSKDQEFYLLTHEADPNDSLSTRAISGTELAKALTQIECPVLLIMDACHSAQAVKPFRPATSLMARDLTKDSVGVTVLAAAMSHEVASATEENGYFTAAFLKALRVEEGVPFDPKDQVLYTHHLYSVIFSEVRHATRGRQNPILNMPWTMPPIALREVAVSP